jgi:hypothetical protein
VTRPRLEPGTPQKLHSTWQFYLPLITGGYVDCAADVGDEEDGACQALARRLEDELRAAKSAQLACGEVLLPADLLPRIARDVLRMAENEPCGLRSLFRYQFDTAFYISYWVTDMILCSPTGGCQHFGWIYCLHRRRVGMATGWTAGIRFPAGERFLSSPQRPDRLWGPPSLLSKEYPGWFPRV